MKCPHCGHEEDRVVESRSIEEGKAIRRRRECEQCKQRFTSYERYEQGPLTVIKKDGRREPFSRDKILMGLQRAVEKRPVSLDDLDRVVDGVERKLADELQREVKTQEIGEIVMEALARLDQVAYVRFASVYRQFRDINEFVKEIGRIEEN